MREQATIKNAHIYAAQSSLEDDSVVADSIITAKAGTPFGQFFVEDTVTISDNEIHADGDRYMDLDPEVFNGVIANNLIYVTITEGVGNSRGGLLELRGRPDMVQNSTSN